MAQRTSHWATSWNIISSLKLHSRPTLFLFRSPPFTTTHYPPPPPQLSLSLSSVCLTPPPRAPPKLAVPFLPQVWASRLRASQPVGIASVGAFLSVFVFNQFELAPPEKNVNLRGERAVREVRSKLAVGWSSRNLNNLTSVAVKVL